jgi:hypothetical protein
MNDMANWADGDLSVQGAFTLRGMRPSTYAATETVGLNIVSAATVGFGTPPTITGATISTTNANNIRVEIGATYPAATAFNMPFDPRGGAVTVEQLLAGSTTPTAITDGRAVFGGGAVTVNAARMDAIRGFAVGTEWTVRITVAGQTNPFNILFVRV